LNMDMNWTGERLETFVFNEATIEHLHRYAIAREYVKDKIVLDLACGEGYGAALLAQEAKSVIAVDIDNATILRARLKYKMVNLQFLTGKAEAVPGGDSLFDVITYFEALEHSTYHTQIISELKRVLKPGGVLILSTPERKNYSDLTGYKNPYHITELYEGELKELLSHHFRNCMLLYQRLFLASVILSDQQSPLRVYEGDYENIRSSDKLEPLYLLAISSDGPIPTPHSSIFKSNIVLQTVLREKERLIKSSMSYKIGHGLLLPLKWIRRQFNHKRDP
jgi:ubiquinone/menaquinone biosynthesis C-methylase UbiE